MVGFITSLRRYIRNREAVGVISDSRVDRLLDLTEDLGEALEYMADHHNDSTQDALVKAWRKAKEC